VGEAALCWPRDFCVYRLPERGARTDGEPRVECAVCFAPRRVPKRPESVDGRLALNLAANWLDGDELAIRIQACEHSSR